jgi:hypothetical protein
MNLYLILIYNSINTKNHFMQEVIEAENETEAENKLINKKYFLDSAQSKILGVCRKVKILHKIE